MSTPELELRMAALEKAVHKIQSDCSDVLAGQDRATHELQRVADEAKAELKAEAASVREELSSQTASILVVSQSMIKLQEGLQKWAAAGTLGGAVVFFILAKVAGL